eukprot:s679_g9.t1
MAVHGSPCPKEKVKVVRAGAIPQAGLLSTTSGTTKAFTSNANDDAVANAHASALHTQPTRSWANDEGVRA